MNKKETFYSGKIDGKRNDKLCSSELQDYRSLFESDNESTAESSSSDSQDEENGNDKWDLNDTIRESFAPTSSVVTNRCTNCGNNMHQQQTFCEKCGNTSKVVNVGEINTTSESKFVSHETIFGTDFRGTNIGSRTVSTSTSVRNGCRSCGHDIHQDQMFCEKCGYKLKTGGNVEKAIEWLLSLPDYDDNLLENPSPTTAQFQSDMKVKKSSLPSYDSVMKMGYTRNQAEDSLRIYGGKVEREEWPPSSTVMHDVSTRKKRTVAEAPFQTRWKNQPSFIFSNESVIEIMSLGFTREQAIDALTFSDGNEEEAVIRLVSHPYHNDVTVKKKVEFFEGKYEHCQTF
ncbi:unnamed protein product [Mytilus edulis]|uniref:UBA domain-containing protein n=1 Tax=Mytilus edulis TaxID=6550 RepID=A0A8S3UP99_MYTED|nr:unnamed protein product [Mytilus edulis]